MRYLSLLIGLLFLCYVQACTKKVTDSIIDSIQQHCDADCEVNLGDVTKFSWDQVIICSELATHSDLVKVVGETNLDPEIKGLIAFTLNKKIVYNEYFELNPESWPEVFFKFPPHKVILTFSRDQARFSVRIHLSDGKKYYELYQPQ